MQEEFVMYSIAAALMFVVPIIMVVVSCIVKRKRDRKIIAARLNAITNMLERG